MLTDREQKLVNWLRTRKVATMRHLQHQFQVSHMTVFRALKKASYHTSYNRKAGYYTLADVPQFDDWGLWAYREQLLDDGQLAEQHQPLDGPDCGSESLTVVG